MLLAFVLYLVLGAIAGVLAGLLGVGGGLVLVAALAWLLPALGVVPVEAAMHAALASSLASIVLTAAASARAHARRGSVLTPVVIWMVPGLLLGGWLGSGFAVRVDGALLRWAVAGYCAIAAAQLLLTRARGVGEPDAPTPRGPLMTLAGGVIGAVSSVVGIGGGSMTVPLLVWRGVAPVRAVGTSSACGVAIGLASAVGYALHAPAGALPQHAVGFVYLPAAIGVATASVFAAPYGTRLAHRLGGAALKRVFAGFLIAVAVSLIVSA
ncbi:sulfite exporter TauE/SafE family protein [Cognatilysobacter bugurensis]|uniref:Probable membrane transporter protein n=1 Tax=Cognatilysobacter bugurensis TaxID=543356 RepID=A0A918SY28_9GAMM|nr:sulfite exporter TauE/SafE family protein [Lysobacter bugurensis]GHA78491.1 UPF0721 transmembrane protein [Lysobacter bugurensis]